MKYLNKRNAYYAIFLLFIFSFTFLKRKDVKLGAYYFDGWAGVYPHFITKKLKDSFSLREPKWGWITSSQEIVDAQINSASNAGLSFFSFCWYYNGKDNYKELPINKAFGYYIKSSQKNKIQYCLLVANHQGFEIKPSDWNFLTKEWIQQFSDESYLKVDNKPLIIFFSLSSFMKNFGSASSVKIALDSLRLNAFRNGFDGVNIAINVNPDEQSVKQAESCGFDVLTGYNYHTYGLIKSVQQQVPIDSMISAERKIWDGFKKLSKLKYIPVSTLNWDPRPWANSGNNYSKDPYFIGFSANSVYRSVNNCIDWLKNNLENTTEDKIGLLYAWNENGEGAWLTPGKNGFNPSKGVKKALKARY